MKIADIGFYLCKRCFRQFGLMEGSHLDKNDAVMEGALSWLHRCKMD